MGPRTKIKAVFMNERKAQYGGDFLDYVFARGRKERIAELTDLYPEVVGTGNFEEHAEALRDVDVVFSTWGMSPLSEAQVRRLPNLKAVFYAAGATRYFREPFVKAGVRISTALRPNGQFVAEFCLAQILLANKGYFRNTREAKDPERAHTLKGYRGPGNYDETVALIGAGSIASLLKPMLEQFRLDVIVVPSRRERRTVSLEEAFENAFVVSNHLPDREDNRGVLNGDLFARMREGAVFINTGRGAQVNEAELIEVLKRRPDLTALLDVQHPEPPEAGSELYALPNVQLTSHFAGGNNNEVLLLADAMIEEFLRWERGEELRFEAQPDQL